eukprot:2389569-Pyramimonas_sp.AAC.1
MSAGSEPAERIWTNCTRSASHGGMDRTCRPTSACRNATKLPTNASMRSSAGRHAPESVLHLHRRTMPHGGQLLGAERKMPERRWQATDPKIG